MDKHPRRYGKWVALLVALALVAGATWLVLRPHPSSYRAVQDGMTLQHVHNLLGPSTTEYYVSLALPDGQPLANGGIGYEE
jgi:hypothetical protein